MVAAVRSGESQRSVARRFGVSLDTVQRWVRHAGTTELEQVDFGDRPHCPRRVANRTSESFRRRIIELRKELADSALGEIGAQAIRDQLERETVEANACDAVRSEQLRIPSLRTINRVLGDHGCFDEKRRVRRPAPKSGWYLPQVANAEEELDAIDIVEGLVIRGGPEIQVLNVMSLHGGLPGSFIAPSFTARSIIQRLTQHWDAVGLPRFAQFDNDTRFHGPHQFADIVGAVSRSCMALGVTPVFAVPREHGPQNLVEGYNASWQSQVWHRRIHESLEALEGFSERYVDARRAKNARRIDMAPARRPLPADWQFDPAHVPSGRIIYLRRSDAAGCVSVLGHRFAVDESWVHRMVRCEFDLEEHRLQFYALRRSDPNQQPLLFECRHVVRLKPLKD
jgi:transposase-like protein